MLLVVSAGHAEDLIGAALLKHLPPGMSKVLPLVGSGKPYHPLGLEPLGPHLEVPSGGFPLNSLGNLIADLRAGFVSTTLGQWRTARLQKNTKAVLVVGDAYALAVGWLATRQSKAALFHIQPLISSHYIQGRGLIERLRYPNQFGAEDFMFYERWLHRQLRASYVRDPATLSRTRKLGMHKAKFLGSFAMDILGSPELDLTPFRDGRPLLALMPGTRQDVNYSLPIMLQSASLLPEVQAMVAWGLPFDRLQLPPDWRIEPAGSQRVQAVKGDLRIDVWRGAFSAIVHQAKVALGTAGTGNEQAAGLGVPVVGFATLGPQYIKPFALRQKWLLGQALHLCEPNPKAIAQALRERLSEGPIRDQASNEGRKRMGPPGALQQIARELMEVL